MAKDWPGYNLHASKPLWDLFGEAVKLSADRELSKAKVIRALMRWYCGVGPLPNLPVPHAMAELRRARVEAEIIDKDGMLREE